MMNYNMIDNNICHSGLKMQDIKNLDFLYPMPNLYPIDKNIKNY